jgi:predicted Zn-dependent protease with MMP-like domain/Fe-S-cluster containining protein
MGNLMRQYHSLLERVDRWFRTVQQGHPDCVKCRSGCYDCCVGLFEVTPLDAATLQEGLRRLPPAERNDILSRAAAIANAIETAFPELVESPCTSDLPEDRWQALMDWSGGMACPVLGPNGECRVYDHRPLSCRLMGVGRMDEDGETVGLCIHNRLPPPLAGPQTLRDDELFEQEERLLENYQPQLGPTLQSDADLLLPHALFLELPNRDLPARAEVRPCQNGLYRPMKLSNERFAELVDEALRSLPPEFRDALQNLAIVIEEEPTAEQLERSEIEPPETLLGLYEGIPLPDRGFDYANVLPDKISIFRGPLRCICPSEEALRHETYVTLIHEIGHYFGLDEDEIAQYLD